MGVEEYLPGKWRLFVGSNKRSLKYVLLYNRNEYSPVPIGDSVHVKEKYEKIKVVLNLLKYQERNWIICIDLKMVNCLLGQQSGYIKYPCFWCLWASHAKEQHWVQRKWPKHKMLTVGKHNIIHEQLVYKEKIVFPPLNIRLDLMKQFVMTLDKDGACFQYISNVFPGLSKEKKWELLMGQNLSVNSRQKLCTINDISLKRCLAISCNSYQEFAW